MATTTERETPMATYECPSCGMSVNATCGACGAPLVTDTLAKDDGSTVQVSRCPTDRGKIKSPMCCGADMSCAVNCPDSLADRQNVRKTTTGESCPAWSPVS